MFLSHHLCDALASDPSETLTSIPYSDEITKEQGGEQH